MTSPSRRATGYTGRDYGSHTQQQNEWLEVCGLRDPQDVYDPPAGPPIPSRAFDHATPYPLDGDHR